MLAIAAKAIKASVVTLGALLLAPVAAHAKPATEPHGSVAGVVGVAFDSGDPMLGLGLRGGYTARLPIYIGGTFVYNISGWVFYYGGVEGGYDLQLEPVTIRPYVGLGLGHEAYSRYINESVGHRDFSDTALTYWFGGTVLINLNEQWFIGGDFKVPIYKGYLLASPSITGGLNF